MAKTPTGKPKMSIAEIEAAALASGKVNQEQIDAAKVKTGISSGTQTPVPTVPQNAQSVTNTQGSNIVPPTQNSNQTGTISPVQEKVQGVVPGSKEYEQLIARGFTPEQIEEQKKKLAPVTTPQGVTTPAATTPTPVQAPTQPNEQNAPNYQDDSEARLAEIVTNLNKFEQTSPSMFDNIDAFKRNFKYDQRSQQQRAVLDDFWRQREQRQQQEQASSMWDSFSDRDIVSGIMSGDLTDNDLLELQRVNPVRYAQLQGQIEKERAYEEANDPFAIVSKVAEQLGIGQAPEVPQLQELYNQLVNTPEVNQLELDLNKKKGEIDLLDEEIANLQSSLEEQYAGTGMTSGTLAAIIADKQEALNKKRRTLAISYNTSLNEYNTMRQQGLDEFDMIERQFALEQQARQAKMQELGFAMDFASFETPEQRDRREWDKFIREFDYKEKGIDPNIHRTVDVKNAKGQTVGYLQWNPETERYDIPIGGGAAMGGGGGGGGGSKAGGDMISLLNEYRNILNSTSNIGLRFSPTKQSNLESLKSEIIAVYKQKQKLGTLDTGVQKLMDGLLGNGGFRSASGWSNQAQVDTVDGLIERRGGNVYQDTSKSDTKTKDKEEKKEQPIVIPTATINTLGFDFGSIFNQKGK